MITVWQHLWQQGLSLTHWTCIIPFNKLSATNIPHLQRKKLRHREIKELLKVTLPVASRNGRSGSGDTWPVIGAQYICVT